MSECRKFLVAGRVQGVFFRISTQREATALGLTGHAINLADGRVEVLACGEPEALNRLYQWLQGGPRMAKVDHVEQAMIEGIPPSTFSTG